MEGNVIVEFFTGEKPLEFKTGTCCTVENIIVESCKYLNIGPFSRHLFGLWLPVDELWLPLCLTIHLTKNKTWLLHLKIRFKVPNLTRLKVDAKTFNYYFYQVRTDFLDGKIPKLLDKDLRKNAFGLAATDIIRLMIELKSSPDKMRYNSRHFIPKDFWRNKFLFAIFGWFLNRNLEKTVNEGWRNSRQSLEFVQEQYLQELLQLVPDYGSEQYSVLVDEGGKYYEVSLVVDPYHPEYPGLCMKKKNKSLWTHICCIEELCHISMHKNETVEISRQNGVPQYFKFCNTPQMHSFVSLLDGYYRLSEKWTFNLCKDLPTPSLCKLKPMKCHGPVGKTYAYQKLKRKSENEIGCYLIRESEEDYDVYYIDILFDSSTQEMDKIRSFRICKDENDYFYTEDKLNSFSSIFELLAHLSKKIHVSLSRCIPPSEYDKTDLLLCRKENLEEKFMVARVDCTRAAQYIRRDDLILSKDKIELFGQKTVVSHGQLRRSCSEYQDVAVKMLLKETKVTHIHEFSSQCEKVLFCKNDAVVSIIGMISSKPTALVMEWLPLGPLNKYLQLHKQQLKQVDLVEAAYHIARALWYLEELHIVHGKIRCRNILVASHTDNSFKVKLADPGAIVYTDADIPWISPEHYNDYSQVLKSSASDVYAFGTTVWEIFSYGANPSATLSHKQNKNYLPFPSGCLKDIENLILECWVIDPDSRKRPQAIVRDVNQIFYEVYNSRRSHSYSNIKSLATPVTQEEKVALPANTSPKEPVFQCATEFAHNFDSNSLLQPSMNNCSQYMSVADVVKASPLMPENIPDSICESSTPRDLFWIIDIEHLSIKGRLGQGFYGEVLKATLTHGNGLPSEEVAVKRIKMSNELYVCFDDLKREIEIMKNLKHKNIVEIKGLVEEPETLLVMEYLELGSLLAYLQLYKNKVSCSCLLKFATDIAEGMEYLEQKHIVHRDLAARNILVASEDHVKISDFGLAQFTEDHYYRMRTDRSLPIRWYALESITEGKFSHKSDVWSYGITLWEMFSFGENPQMSNVPDKDLVRVLQTGQRLRLTEHCPADVYSLMHSCWEQDSHDRPSFRDIIQKLKKLCNELCP